MAWIFIARSYSSEQSKIPGRLVGRNAGENLGRSKQAGFKESETLYGAKYGTYFPRLEGGRLALFASLYEPPSVSAIHFRRGTNVSVFLHRTGLLNHYAEGVAAWDEWVHTWYRKRLESLG
jgi:hypothetical protein